MTKVLIKRLSKTAIIPKYKTSGSSGMDISANIDSVVKILPGKSSIIPTGLPCQYLTDMKSKFDQGLA